MPQLRWRFAEEARARAFPPERARFRFGDQASDSPFLDRSFAHRWRAIEHGYRTQPADCPPVRRLSRYGFVARCPGAVRLRRGEAWRQERLVGPRRAEYGLAEIEGDPWPGSDSGLVASWILGSEYVKVHTGVELLIPPETWVYQGPVPNASLGGPALEVMAGVEGRSASRTVRIDGRPWTASALNVIVRLPPPGTVVEAQRGEIVAWFFPVPAGGAWQLAPAADAGARP